MKTLSLFCVTILFSVGQSLDAATIRVPQDYATIQAGIDAAHRGDTVQVAAGVYPGNLTLKEGIQLVGSGANETIIMASEGSVIKVDNITEGAVADFTIDGQDSSRYGIYCSNTGHLLRIQGNRVENIWGDGIFCYYASPTISNNTITEVVFDGIYLNWSGPTITNNIITYTGINGIHSEVGTQNPPHIKGNTITNTGRDGVFCHNDSSPLIEDNTIRHTGHHGIECHNRSSPVIRRNRISFSSEDGINCNGNSRPKLRENQVHNNLGNGVFSDARSLPNLGTDMNPGRNQIYDNAKFEVHHENPWELQAKGNGWGADPPDPKEFFGAVNYTPWLNPLSVWDINSDSVINIFDIVIVGQNFGQEPPQEPRADVNADGKVDVFDLVLIGSHFGEGTVAAPSSLDSPTNAASPEALAAIQQALVALEAMPEKSYGAEVAIALLRAWVANVKPIIAETKLLPNYPNPFNPETWLPYQLASDADVTIGIYDISGGLVRQLVLGKQNAGLYLSRDRAAYWDGRSETGELVGSGLYFYQLRAGDDSAMKRMVVLK